MGRCIECLKKLEDNSIDLIITSPPYNKKGFLGKENAEKSDDALWNKVIEYGEFKDDLKEDKYQKEQKEFLNECFRVLKPTGSMFYNHKVRIKNNTTSFPTEWIHDTKFIIRQEIIWDRGGSVNVNTCRYLPTTERIYWLTKSEKNVRFTRQDSTSEVWRFPPALKNKHPAPFPVDIPDTIIKSVLGDKKMRAELGSITVLDPYMGSGTTAVSAIKHGCDWIGFDISNDYQKMAYDRIKEEFPDYEFDDTIDEVPVVKEVATMVEVYAATSYVDPQKVEEVHITGAEPSTDETAVMEISETVTQFLESATAEETTTTTNTIVKSDTITHSIEVLPKELSVVAHTNEKTAKTKKRAYRVSVGLYHLNGKFCKRYNSVYEAEKDIGKKHGNVHLKNGFGKAHQYLWLQSCGEFPEYIDPTTVKQEMSQ